MFILSSASKTVTATALMHLFQQDLFTLNDNVNDYLSFDIIHPDYPEVPITFKMLLCCNISRETFSGKSLESTTPLTNRRYNGRK